MKMFLFLGIFGVNKEDSPCYLFFLLLQFLGFSAGLSIFTPEGKILPIMERTLILLKPDALERALVGEILARFERRGFRLVALKVLQFTEELTRVHYAHLVREPFFHEILSYITRSPSIAVILEGPDVIKTVRSMVGPTCGKPLVPGTIRGDYAIKPRENLIHASDSPDAAKCEIQRFFQPEEIISNHF